MAELGSNALDAVGAGPADSAQIVPMSAEIPRVEALAQLPRFLKGCAWSPDGLCVLTATDADDLVRKLPHFKSIFLLFSFNYKL